MDVVRFVWEVVRESARDADREAMCDAMRDADRECGGCDAMRGGCDAVEVGRLEHGRLYAVELHNFLGFLYAGGLMRQVEVDMPRSECLVNGTRVRTIGQFRAALRVAGGCESFLHAMLPFVSQATMAAPLRSVVAHGIAVTDGRGPLHVHFNVSAEERYWSVCITKDMRCFGGEGLVELSVIYESYGDAVMFYWMEHTLTSCPDSSG